MLRGLHLFWREPVVARELLEAALGRRVLKCGVSGYGSGQELIKARRWFSTPGRQPLAAALRYTRTTRIWGRREP